MDNLFGKNVLIIGNNTKHGKLFKEMGANVFLVVNIDGANQRQYSELNQFNLICSKTKPNSFKGFFTRIKEIKKWVKEHNIDILFLNRKDDLVYSKISFLFKKHRPLILCTLHNSQTWSNHKKAFLMSKVLKHCCDGFICLASFVKTILLKNKFPVKKLLFLPNTIEYEDFKIKTNYKIAFPKVKIAYCAVIKDLKNQLFIIECLNELKTKYAFEMHFIGNAFVPEYEKTVCELIKKYGMENNIILDGPKDNTYIKEHLSDFDIYFNASKKEMSPYNILEAKAAGLPILASRAYGQQDLIQNEFDGLLFDEFDADDVSKKLDSLLSSESKRRFIGQNALISSIMTRSYKMASIKLLFFINKLK